MDREKRRGCCGDRTPWDRGLLANSVRARAAIALTEELSVFAAEEVEECGAEDATRDFRKDARRIIRLEASRAWIARTCAETPGLAPCDAEAAIVSVYADVVVSRFRQLYEAYGRFLADYLAGILSYTLSAIHLDLSADERRQAACVPMAGFFFDSLRACESDPNTLRPSSDSPRRLRTRPYGWSPTCDPFITTLLLLLTRQGSKARWPNALLASPLSYRLQAAGIAKIVPVERHFCPACRKYFAERALGGMCPECGHGLETRRRFHLLGTRHIEAEMLNGAMDNDRSLKAETPAGEAGRKMAERETEDRPGQEMETAEEYGIERERALGLVSRLWRRAASGKRSDVPRMAVLLALANLDSLPDEAERLEPKPEWIEGVLGRLQEKTLRGLRLFVAAQRHFAALSGRPEADLEPGNVRVIVWRFRQRLLRKA